MQDALELLPADYWRWFLLANAPESDDASFTWPLFADAVNSDLVGTLGNFINRCATQIDRHFDGLVPAGGSIGADESDLVARLGRGVAEYCRSLDRLEFRKGAQALRSVWSEGNIYLEARQPWRQIKVDREAAAATLRTACGLIRLFGHLSAAYIPATSRVLGAVLPQAPALSGVGADLSASVLDIEPGQRFVAPGLLFTKIDQDQVEEWEVRFGGPT